MFPVHRIRASAATAVEYLGTKSKFWFREGDRLLLFKAEERGTGEDWAEKIACELAALLGLPHVHYEMAYDDENERPGVVCETCAPAPLSLAHGNQLLLDRDPAYPANVQQRYRSSAHTVDAVFACLRGLDRPRPEWCGALPPGIDSAVDVFAGYLLLDAWVANQDRHHENWGAIWDEQQLSLAPSFDHGAALARNLSDEERHERLTSRDVNRRIPHFAGRAKSALYADVGASQSLSTVAAWRAFAERAPTAAAWQRQLALISHSAVASILQRIPPERMSAVCRQFTLDLLGENRLRLLE